MRDLITYPIKAEEAISALQIALEQYTKHITEDEVGGTNGLALLMAEQFITANKEEFNKFTKESLRLAF